MTSSTGGPQSVETEKICQIDQYAHDMKSCLHAIHMGLTLLQMDEVRRDEKKFLELCQSIDAERKRADEIIRLLQAAAREARQ